MTILNRLFICCALLLSGKTLAHDGTVYITGVVKGKTCIVSPDSEQLVVEMHDVAARQLAGQKTKRPMSRSLLTLKPAAPGYPPSAPILKARRTVTIAICWP